MPMLSDKDYEDLKPYLPMLKLYKESDIYIGCDIFAFKQVYDRIAHENLNVTCGGCISNSLRVTNDLIKEYNNSWLIKIIWYICLTKPNNYENFKNNFSNNYCTIDS